MREYREVRNKSAGDSEAAAPYMGYARTVLGDVKAEMQRGGLEQLSREKRLPDGTIVTVTSRFGQDSIRIRVPPRAPSDSPSAAQPEVITTTHEVDIPTLEAPEPAEPITPDPPETERFTSDPVERIAPVPIERFAVVIPDDEPAEDFTPTEPEIPEPGEVEPFEEIIAEEERFDEGITQFVVWLRLASAADSPITKHSIAAWNPAAGFLGREVALTGGYVRGTVIFLGYVWWAGLGFAGAPDVFYRARLSTGEVETLLSRAPGEGTHTIVSTVTPAGVMFAVGRLNTAIVMFAPDGSVVYNVAAGFIGLTMTMFVNDGNSAYLGWMDQATTNSGGIEILDVNTGAVQSSIALSDNSIRYVGQGVTGVLAGGSMYGLQSRRVEGDELSEFAEVYTRTPSASAAAVIGDMNEYYPGETVSEVHSSAVSLSLNGTPVILTAWDLAVVDKTSNTVSKTRLSALYGITNPEYADNVRQGASVIPDKRKVMFTHYANDAPWATPDPVKSILTYDLDTGVAGRYIIDNLKGYLIQYKVIPPINPRITDLPFMPEWGYLSHTSVNPD